MGTAAAKLAPPGAAACRHPKHPEQHVPRQPAACVPFVVQTIVPFTAVHGHAPLHSAIDATEHGPCAHGLPADINR
jgi:hypothetical protein